MTRLAGLALTALIGASAGALVAGSASAADLASPEPIVAAEVTPNWDVAFGVAGLTDYVFRGVSQTRNDPAIQGYAELQAFGFYAGVWGSNVQFNAAGASDPSSEVDFYGGYRTTLGAFGIDVGGLYYWYPGERRRDGLIFPIREIDYWEIYAKPSITVFDVVSLTGNAFYTTDFVNVSADALYLSVIPKVAIPVSAFPDLGFYVSGELGKQWVKKERFGAALPNYLTWNVGAGVTYKAMTLDVRYSDTNLKRGECIGYAGFSRSCDERIVGKIAFDTSLNKLK